MMQKIVDVRFRLQGNQIPADHGYHLLSAIAQLIPELHSDEEVGVHPISGRPSGNRCIAISKGSLLTIRLPAARISQILPLAGKALKIGAHTVRVGTPQTMALTPATRLYSRLVVIKGFLEPQAFVEAAQRQLEELDIKGKPSLVAQPHVAEANVDKHTGTRSPFLRRTIRIRDKEVVGFAIRVDELTAEESIRLQERGLGGRRRFGCGIFIPDRR
jgi:CRISPR-associated protein Cas6